MHRDVINAAIALSTIVRFLGEDELPIFMKYIDFMVKKHASGQIVDADSMIEAIDEFAQSLIDDDEI